ncbi:MAG: hypothetical protein MHM6MM_007672 [Cercozoa sp. M6MM]
MWSLSGLLSESVCTWCCRSDCAADFDAMQQDNGRTAADFVCPECQRKKREEESQWRNIPGSKHCPFCDSPITHFKGDGCHHIGYNMNGCPGKNKDGSRCGKHWCYYCLSPWPGPKCQEEHWFCHSTDDCDCPLCPECEKLPGSQRCPLHA